MKCPHCHAEVNEGKFCSNCSKPLNPKWYQKNSPITIILMLLAFAFLAICVYFSVSMGLLFKAFN